MGVNTVTIEQRYYLGHFREGTVFNSIEDYLIDGNKVSVLTRKRFYLGRDEKGANKFGIARQTKDFELNAEDVSEFERILARIKDDPDMRCAADHYKKGVFDRRRYDYFYVVVNGTTYELNKGDAEVAGGLFRILRVDEMLQSCETGINEEKPKVVAAENEEPILLEKPDVHEPEKILAKNDESAEEKTGEPVNEIVIEMKEPEEKTEEKPEEAPAEDAKPAETKRGFHRELLTGTNYANWNQVVGKY